MLSEDDLSQHREVKAEKLDQCYIDAFHRIDADPNQYLMVVTSPIDIIGTCHLTLNNLNNLSPCLNALMSYFKLHVDLVQAAAEPSQNTDTSNDDLEKLITKLSEDEKNTFLLSLFKNEPDLNLGLKRTLYSLMPSQEKESLSAQRTVAHLKGLAEQSLNFEKKK